MGETDGVWFITTYLEKGLCKKVLEDGRVLSTAYKRPQTRKGGHEWWKDVYDEYYDCVLCPEYQLLTYRTTNREGYREYRSDPKICIHCPTRHLCTCSKNCVTAVQRLGPGYQLGEAEIAARNLKKLAIWLWREKLFPFICIPLCTPCARNPAYAQSVGRVSRQAEEGPLQAEGPSPQSLSEAGLHGPAPGFFPPPCAGLEEQQPHPCRQQGTLGQGGLRRQRKRRVQRPQCQGILGEKPSVPEPQGLRQRERRAQEGNRHPGIDQPGPRPAQQPAAAQGERQRRGQDRQGGEEQASPPVPAEIHAVEQGGLRQAGQRQQAGPRQGGGTPHQGVPPRRRLGRVGEHGRPPCLGGGEKGEEEQGPHPEQGEHPAQVVAEAPGGEGGGVGHPQDGDTVQHLPPVEQEHQKQPEGKLVPQQPPALISK